MKTYFSKMFRAVCGLLLVAAAAHGQELQMSTNDLTTRADVVVVGKVAKIQSAWTSDKTRIVTNVSLAVDQQLKGEGTGSMLTLVTLGGEVDGVGEWYSHSARFKQGEEVVVFAKKDMNGRYRVSGGAQGKLPVSRDPEKGIALVAGQRTLEEFSASVRKAVGIQQAPTEN